MWPYWMMFLLPATAAVLSSGNSLSVSRQRSAADHLTWSAALVGLTLIVGYRSEVGGDWFNYLENFENFRGAPFVEALRSPDPGYHVVSWAMAKADLGVHEVNLVCAALFSLGLITFCRSMPRPWVALTVATPYLVIVVGMGYSRQAVALGLEMLALAALNERSFGRFFLWVCLGATFHRTAVLLLPLAALVNTRNRKWIVFWVLVITVSAYLLLLSESVSNLYEGYVESEYQSQGALVRLLMNAVPAVLFFWFKRSLQIPLLQLNLWRWFALISLALLAALLFTNASTAVDRIALYMLPLQLVVFSYLPAALARHGSARQSWITAVVIYYAVVLFVWLNFAVHSTAWVPYQFYPLQVL